MATCTYPNCVNTVAFSSHRCTSHSFVYIVVNVQENNFGPVIESIHISMMKAITWIREETKNNNNELSYLPYFIYRCSLGDRITRHNIQLFPHYDPQHLRNKINVMDKVVDNNNNPKMDNNNSVVDDDEMRFLEYIQQKFTIS